MSRDEFKFLITQPIRDILADKRYQTLSIMAKFPTFYYRLELDKNSKFAERDQIRIAVAELKVELIKSIANAEFEMEDIS